jgi:signal transduction histidine kinase
MNTPAQFVSADLDFLSEACDALLGLIGAYREAIAEAAMGPLSSGTLASLAGREASAGLDFLAAEAPAAARSAARGVARIAEIVAAMKEFAGSPGQGAAAADLNRVVRATLIVAEGQCRDIAAVQYSLGELPEVRCRASEVAEVLLGLFANAVEAIDAAGRRGAGLLRVSTQVDGGGARVDVADNGCGIPDSLAARLFDSPGRARDAERGQTLGAARAVIVEGHGGRLWFDTRVGEGSTFHVWLPFEPPAAQSVEA